MRLLEDFYEPNLAQSWPEEALERVAMVHLVDLIPEKLQYSVMTACKVFHMDSRLVNFFYYVTV